MKYNLSEIMKTAHTFRKSYRWTMSQALKTAWRRAKNLAAIDEQNVARKAAYQAMSTSEKIENLKGQQFILRMKDRWNDVDYTDNSRLNSEIARLEAISKLEEVA